MNTRIQLNRGVVFLAATVLLIALRDCLKIPVNFSIFSGISLIASVFLSQNERFLYLFSLLPFSRGLPYSEMMLLIIAVDLVDTFLIKKERKVDIGIYFPILGISIIDIIDSMKFGIYNMEFIYLALYMFTASYAVERGILRRQEKSFIYGYALCTAAAVALVVIREISELGLEYIYLYNVRFGANTNGRMVTNFNSNEMGLYCLIAVCLLMVLSLKKDKHTSFSFYLSVFISLIGLVSISRTYILLLTLSWIVYFILSDKSFIKLIAAGITIYLSYFMIQNLAPRFVEWIRKYFVTRSHTSAGRMNLVVDYFNWSFSSIWSFLFGYSEYYPQVLHSTAAHNGIQEIMVCWGFTGLILCLIWMALLLKKSLYRPVRIFQWLPAAAFFLFIQSVQLFTMHGYLLLMVLAMSVLGMKGAESSEQRTESTYSG